MREIKSNVLPTERRRKIYGARRRAMLILLSLREREYNRCRLIKLSYTDERPRTRELHVRRIYLRSHVIFTGANCYRAVIYLRGDVTRTLKYNGF